MIRFVIYVAIGFFLCSIMNNPTQTKEYVAKIIDFISLKATKLKDDGYFEPPHNTGGGYYVPNTTTNESSF